MGDKEREQKLIVVALVRNEKGEILLQKRNDPLFPEAHGKWEFPGGRVNFGEEPAKAAQRECEEEVDCRIEILRLFPTVETKVWEATNGEINQVFVVCFEARLVGGTPHPNDKKVSEVRWCSKEDIATLDILANVKKFIAFIET